jgi:hypothetical protein
MAYVHLHVTASSPLPAADRERTSFPVILDGGDCARVVTVTFSRVPQLGDRFNLESSVWEIVRVRDLLRGFVARAMTAGACVH